MLPGSPAGCRGRRSGAGPEPWPGPSVAVPPVPCTQNSTFPPSQVCADFRRQIKTRSAQERPGGGFEEKAAMLNLRFALTGHAMPSLGSFLRQLIFCSLPLAPPLPDRSHNNLHHRPTHSHLSLRIKPSNRPVRLRGLLPTTFCYRNSGNRVFLFAWAPSPPPFIGIKYTVSRPPSHLFVTLV